MTTSDTQQLVNQKHQVLQIICMAILGSLVVYSGIAWFLLQQSPDGIADPSSLPPFLPMVLAGVAVMTLMSGEAVARMLQARAAQGASPEARVTSFFQGVIVGFALREAVGVIGLVTTIISGQLVWVVALSAVAAAAMVVAWPRREQLEALARTGPAPIG